MLGRRFSILRFFFHRHGLLAFAMPKVIELGTAHTPGSLDLNLGDARGVERKNTFHPFPVGDTANRERAIEPSAAPADHNARENLNSFFVALHYASVNSDGIANLKRRGTWLQLLLLNLLNDYVHTMLQAAWKAATTNSAS
jgi:hypothetical protein